MSHGTITSTVNNFGDISGEVNGVVQGTITGSIGVPGPTGATGQTGQTGAAGIQGIPGPVGPVSPGVAIGGTTGQVLRKLSGTNYDTGWLTLGTMASEASADYSTTAQASALYYPLSGNPSAFLTASALTPYITSATAAATYYLQSNPAGYISGVAWGAITGTLSDQTDLQDALDAKYDASNPSAYITASALAPYATIDAPTFTGVVTIPSGATIGSSVNIGVYATLGNDASTVTQANSDNSTRLATTAFVKNQSYLPGSSAAATYFTIASAANKADLASPALTGVPSAPTATAGTSTTQLATTAFVTTADNLKAPLASPTFTGTVTIPSGASITGYLTTASAASTYYLQTNPSAFITSSALTPYLLTSTAASTYAPLASPSLSGVPTGPTAGISDNSSRLATTAYVKGQGYITSAPVTSVAGRTGAVVVALSDVSGAAAINSQAFTGTPSLPTGTTAITQTAGNSTTALATTAFVNTAVPTFATFAQSRSAASTTTINSPRSLMWARTSNSFRSLSPSVGMFTSTTTGMGGGSQVGMHYRQGYIVANATPTIVGTVSLSTKVGNINYNQGLYIGTNGTNAQTTINYSNIVWMSARWYLDMATTNNTIRTKFGQGYGSAVTGDLNGRGYGVKVVNRGGALVLCHHNGTTYTETTSSFTPAQYQTFDWDIISESGTVTLYVNGTSVASSSTAVPAGIFDGEFGWQFENTTYTSQTYTCSGLEFAGSYFLSA